MKGKLRLSLKSQFNLKMPMDQPKLKKKILEPFPRSLINHNVTRVKIIRQFKKTKVSLLYKAKITTKQKFKEIVRMIAIRRVISPNGIGISPNPAPARKSRHKIKQISQVQFHLRKYQDTCP